MICFSILPLVFLVWNQAAELRLTNTAIHLLYDELERGIDEGITNGKRIVELNGTVYEISWKESTTLLEVCVKYESENAVVYEKCRSPE